ncbi:cytochrome o ubiquinol oxidase subunit IV [Candidatus Hamiltonella defensa]|uniref:Cytochrome bo(3) ubiquinol oxidase subunit 4 n=1 Tax=Candidatus Williamhamiltonella defendens TaxID=138072 RepID=A0AAC9YF08_9ENTR|nr:cytochrome o ubiquinol oxidase subunit IV [Candidatus Hamiltonella defensa]ASV32835.1 cytochrome o ubiquinol oxidase subunit IV [Candidatus Hamiltonella defensa]AWK15787.1 cytochrome o ubiquinol oxidase subunit IV [Candidatus Hamiltonella defensa]MBK4361269.1 cytochrome o ubiquinol oxidase subunit IV [Candidatus Hamiltonella defensa]
MNHLKTDPNQNHAHAIKKPEKTIDHLSAERGGAHQGSLKSYVVGFILSIMLTVIPFMMVMNQSASRTVILATVIATAVVQIIVHLVYFLHMNGASEERWNLVAFIFTVIIIAIVLVGSLWIMHHLNINMMIQ